MRPVTMQSDQAKPCAGLAEEHRGFSPLLSGEGALVSRDEYAGPQTPRPWELPGTVGLTLTLLTMLRSRPPRRNGSPWREWNLPNGCVLAVRYSSR